MPRTVWPPYQTLRPLIHRHVGRIAVVMGGGPSMVQAIPHSPLDAVYISVNDHGLRYFKHSAPGDPRRCSYVVACDKVEHRARSDIGKKGDGQAWGLPVISRHMWADYRLLCMPAPSSGMTAAYVARLLGCAPIIITGMDLYDGPTYHDDAKAFSTGKHLKPSEHLARWRKMWLKYPGMYRTLGCHKLLQGELGRYDQNEKTPAPVPVDQLIVELQAVRCQIRKPAVVCQREFPPCEIELMDREVKDLQKQGKGSRVASY
jgi:hypothetical protein